MKNNILNGELMSISIMEQEALQAPQVLAKQFVENKYILQELCARLSCYPPPFAQTIARGSSDHAATFAKYLLETHFGLVTASAAPSVVTLYNTNLKLKNSLVIALSQSGQSPDIAEMLINAREAGAITVALVNQVNSPLGDAAEYVIPLWAGTEHAVAATKSYIATLGALIQWMSLLTQDPKLQAALQALPNALIEASKMDWSQALPEYQNQKNTFVVGRGFGFPIAQEAALKFKETAQIHAEAFSGAEILHGPFALVQPNFPLLMFGQRDASLPGIVDLAKRVKTLGAKVMLAVPEHADNEKYLQDNVASVLLPLPKPLHPVCDPLMGIQAFYMMMARLAGARGYNPDAPMNLSKVTKTW
jgi:glucosamine--fructose-6-phosphate aminotransferase (isomerizing)